MSREHHCIRAVVGSGVSGHFGKLNLHPEAGTKTDKWGLILKTLDDTDVAADRLTTAPGGYTGWHAHPGPVMVTVTRGSVVWYHGEDPLCTSRTYGVGQSFVEPAYKFTMC